jgi:hypothetical protein
VRTVNRELERLLDEGQVEALGEARARRYRRARRDLSRFGSRHSPTS